MIKRAAVALFVLASGACSSPPSPEAGELRVTPLGGSVTLVDGGESTLLEEAATVDAGVSVITQPGGRAKVDLPGEQTMELAPGSKLLVGSDVSELSEGRLLVRTSSPLMLRAGGTDIEASEAVFRVETEPSVLLATYSGAVTVPGSGVEPITALREVSVLQGGDIVTGIEAMDIRPNDPWDAAILGRAIDLGLQLLNYERGLTRQLPSDREIDAVTQILERQFPRSTIRSAISELGNAASVVVAAVVAGEASRFAGQPAKSILTRILGLRSIGANWIGIVAELGLPAAAAAVTEELRALASAISDLVTPPPAPTLTTASSQTGSTAPQNDAPSSDTGSSGGNPGSGSGNDGGGGGPPGQTTNTQPPGPTTADQDSDGNQNQQPSCGSTVECTVDDILDTPRTIGVPI